MKKLYFGRYLYKPSLVHCLNPIAKLFMVLILIAYSAAAKSWIGLLSSILIICLVLAFAKISVREFLPSILSFKFLFIITFFIQLFFNPQGEFSLHPDMKAFELSIFTTFRFVMIIAISALFTLTTTPLDIAKSIYLFTYPLKLFKVNRQDIAISLIVAIRFIPLLFEEADKIITAQKLRGIWNRNSSFFEKFKYIIKTESFIIPLFMRSFNYAENISITLCYRKNIDSVMKLKKINIIDVIFIFAVLIYIAGFYAIQ